MKNFRIKVDGCKDSMFDYPCVDANSNYLLGKKISIITSNEIVDPSWFEGVGAMVLINPENKDTSFTNVGIVMPCSVISDNEEGYYQVMDYYIQTLQLFVHKQKTLPGFKHLIVVLPAKSDEYSTSLIRMAYYAVYGLVKGLGKMYGPYGLFVNGIILNENNPQKNLQDRLLLMASDNSCNIIGQVFKL